MKIRSICLAAAAMTLAACSNDELTEVSQTPITFNVTSENVTRAADVYCQYNLPETFNLYAVHNDGSKYSVYINNDVVRKSSANKWYIDGGDRYWPSGTLDFYALVNAPASYSFSQTEGTPNGIDFTVDNTVSKQVDLLYAAVIGQTKDANSSSPVSLNFRHALSQIAFKAKNLNSHLAIKISGVKIANIKGEGTFKLPSASTSRDVEHGQADPYTIANQGTWTLAGDNKSYSIDATAKLKGATETAFDLTGNVETIENEVLNKETKSYTNAMLLLPQTTSIDKWTKGTSPTGYSYLALDCEIYNYSGASSLDSEIKLWPKSEVKKTIYIPTSFAWEQGKKYTYVFIFGDHTTAAYDEDGNDVLVPISYEVTVDDFVNAGEKEIIDPTTTTK